MILTIIIETEKRVDWKRPPLAFEAGWVVVLQFLENPCSSRKLITSLFATWGWKPPVVSLESSTSFLNWSNFGPSSTWPKAPLEIIPSLSQIFKTTNAHSFLQNSKNKKNWIKHTLIYFKLMYRKPYQVNHPLHVQSG